MSVLGHIVKSLKWIFLKKRTPKRKSKKVRTYRPHLSSKKKHLRKRIVRRLKVSSFSHRKKRKRIIQRAKTQKQWTKVKPSAASRPKKKRTLKRKNLPLPLPTAKQRARLSAKPRAQLDGVLVGEITHFFSRISVCVIKMTHQSIRIGDRLRIQGKTSHFIQPVRSLQIESNDVAMARKGQLVGLKTDQRAKEGDQVFRVS
jgi:hypothetical protein